MLKSDIINSILMSKGSIKKVNETILVYTIVIRTHVCKILGLCFFAKLGFPSIQIYTDQIFIICEYWLDCIKKTTPQ